LIATETGNDTPSFQRIAPQMVGGPQFLNDPFISAAVSLILATGDNTSDQQYIAGTERLSSLGQVHAMRELLMLRPMFPIWNYSIYQKVDKLMEEYLINGDVDAFFNMPAGGRDKRESIEEFRDRLVKSIADQIMARGATDDESTDRVWIYMGLIEEDDMLV